MTQSTETTAHLREQVDAAHRDLQKAVGERFTTIDSAAFEAMRQIEELRAERDALKAAIEGLHTPIVHGGITICAHCSGWNGFRCRGEIRPHPCATVEALNGGTST